MQEALSFKQLPTKKKNKLLIQFTKTGKYSFLNLGIIQNVCMHKADVVPTEKGTTPLKIGYFLKKSLARGI